MRKRQPSRWLDPAQSPLDLALVLVDAFWARIGLAYVIELEAPPENLCLDREEVYAVVRLAALRTAGRIPRDDRFRRRVWREMYFALGREMRRAVWWLDDEGMDRLKAAWAAGASPTVDLERPLSFTDVVDPDPACLTHLVDDLPDRNALPVDVLALRAVQRRQVRALVERLPHKYRGPVWRVHALGEDVFTASRVFGLRVSECHRLVEEGLARLRRMVERNPAVLLPPDGEEDGP